MTTKKLTKNKAVSICYYSMILADGKVDDNEITWAHKSPIALKYQVGENRGWFAELMEKGEAEAYVKMLPTPALKNMSTEERNAIAMDLMIMGAIDGKVDEVEKKMLIATYQLLGGSEANYNALMQKMAKAGANKKSSGGCFVATATMGDYNHPVVLDLRTFRDETLRSSIPGRMFIYLYYKIGPFFANIIKKSRTLRNLSFKFLIKPLHSLVAKK
tara:strand:+ start:137 stop:784 length:648 start_codon:yes stop_codon:yes gene_type:complete